MNVYPPGTLVEAYQYPNSPFRTYWGIGKVVYVGKVVYEEGFNFEGEMALRWIYPIYHVAKWQVVKGKISGGWKLSEVKLYKVEQLCLK